MKGHDRLKNHPKGDCPNCGKKSLVQVFVQDTTDGTVAFHANLCITDKCEMLYAETDPEYKEIEVSP